MRKQQTVKKAKDVQTETEMRNVKLKTATLVPEKKVADEVPAKPSAVNETKNLPATVAGSDGFDDSDEGEQRLIRGTIIRCVDGDWFDKEETKFPLGTQLLALGMTQALQHWQDGTVIEPPIRKIPGQPLPDVEELNAQIPKSEWEESMNGPREPWQHVYVVYLLEPKTGTIYTFINNTVGARIAYERLQDRVKWTRALRGEKVYPLVALDNKPMKTQHGLKKRPEFTVIEFRDLGGGSPTTVPAIGPKTGPSDQQVGKPVEPVTSAEAMDDEIPF
jgi:hypothetical protein